MINQSHLLSNVTIYDLSYGFQRQFLMKSSVLHKVLQKLVLNALCLFLFLGFELSLSKIFISEWKIGLYGELKVLSQKK